MKVWKSQISVTIGLETLKREAQKMTQVQEFTKLYQPEGIYYCDESGQFWKMIRDRGCSTTQVTGSKKFKAQITAHFCCTASGTDKFLIWF